MDLIEDLNEGHIVFTDSYYNSIHFARKLEDKGFGICGSICKNRKEMTKIDYDKLKKYDIRILSQRMKKSDLSLIVWKDNKILRLLTNTFETYKNIDVERSDETEDETHLVKMPFPIAEYNKYMGGVDLSDQFCSNIETEKKTFKWWKKLFFHIMDVCVVNAWIIY